MEKITKKQYIEGLKNSKYKTFISAIWHQNINNVLKQMEEVDVNLIDESLIIYKWIDIVEKSNSIITIQENGEKSYCYFDNKNNYYKVNEFLIHETIYSDNSNSITIKY